MTLSHTDSQSQNEKGKQLRLCTQLCFVQRPSTYKSCCAELNSLRHMLFINLFIHLTVSLIISYVHMQTTRRITTENYAFSSNIHQ